MRDGGGKGPVLKELSEKGRKTYPEIGTLINLQLAKKEESWKRTGTIITRKIGRKILSIWAKIS